jgi:hypothetical protein
MHLPFWLSALLTAWLAMAALAVGIIAWVARYGPSEEQALAQARRAPGEAPAAPAPVPAGSAAASGSG